ncbi:MAG: GAF and ANTAR domain-containing protein [Jatrophihabitantaceae bacterium]
MTTSAERIDSLSRPITPLLAPGRTEPVAADTEFELTVGLAELIRNLANDATLTGEQALAALLDRFVEALPGACCASITTQLNPRKPPATFAATQELAVIADSLQYDASQGPCLQALGSIELVQVDDLATDQRWPGFGRQVADRLPLRSVLSVPVSTADHGLQSLNIYGEQPTAFTAGHRPAAYLAAAVTGLALTALREHERSEHLRTALDTNRQIGTAMGILMARHHCSYDNAFTALRVASQHLHRKLRDVADEVIFTGMLPTKPRPHSATATDRPKAETRQPD